jgi:Ca2+-transporting ATPase
MITGDHLLTGEAIARDLGIIQRDQHGITGAQIDQMSDDELRQALETTSAYARVSPEHKLRLVKLLQEKGHVVAMTGDGVNDAPALKQADIGVAMGITGTEVSKGAADMVLTDDNFASIVAAVEEGRTIYDNIRKFIRYLLSSNVGEILVIFLALLVGWPIPLIAIQILWINLVTDGLPAIALGFEPAEPGVMKRKPRPPQESIFAGGLGTRIIWMAVVLAVVTLAGYWWGFSSLNLAINDATLNMESFSAAQLADLIGADEVPANWDNLSLAERSALLGESESEAQLTLEETAANPLLNHAERYARTIAFTVLALGQIFHVSAIHAGVERSFLQVWFKKNPFLLWAVLGTFALQLAVVYLPFLQSAFETVSLSLRDLLISLALASVVLWVVELEKLVRRARRGPEKA